MGTTNRVKTWNPGDVLTAGDLNGEFNNILTTVNGHIDTANIDLTISPTWTGTHKFNNPIVGSVFAALGSGTYNLGLTLSAGVLTVTDGSGNALSATNPGYVYMPSQVTAGKMISLKIIANQTIQDNNNVTPQVLGSWGVTQNTIWGSAMPAYLYCVNKDDTAANARFAIARAPHYATTPSSVNNIGVAGSAPATSSQTNFVLFGTTANTGYASVPSALVGSLQMTCPTVAASEAGMKWQFGTLSAGRDGFGKFQKGISFTNPQGQNGNDATKLFTRSGGTTALNFSTQSGIYYIDTDGTCTYQLTCLTRSANGAGGTQLLANAPLASLNTSNVIWHGPGEGTINNVASPIQAAMSANTTNVRVQNSSGNLADSSFANANDYIEFNITFLIQ